MKLPAEVPVMTLPNATLFPQAMLPLYIYEPRYRRMLGDALASGRIFSVAMQKPGARRGTPCAVAGLGLIRASVRNKDGTSHLILQGLGRIQLEETVRQRPYRIARYHMLATPEDESARITALTDKIREIVEQRAAADSKLPKVGAVPDLPPLNEFVAHLAKMRAPDQVADMAACVLLQAPAERQAILEAVDLESRLKLLVGFLLHQEKSQPPGL